MDVRMPQLYGIEATRRICGSPETAGTRVLILTMFDLDAYVYAALRAGASGFPLKDTPPARRGADGRAHAAALRDRGDPADLRLAGDGRHPGAHPDDVRPGRVRVRGAARGGQRLPAQ